MPKQIVISKLGGPEVLNYQEYSLPKIIKDKEVRIRHTAIGLNYIDTYHRSGIYPLPSELPVCLGMEATGEIIEIGNAVTKFNDDRFTWGDGDSLDRERVRDFLVRNYGYSTDFDGGSLWIFDGTSLEETN